MHSFKHTKGLSIYDSIYELVINHKFYYRNVESIKVISCRYSNLNQWEDVVKLNLFSDEAIDAFYLIDTRNLLRRGAYTSITYDIRFTH